jgi:hypothetical protein
VMRLPLSRLPWLVLVLCRGDAGGRLATGVRVIAEGQSNGVEPAVALEAPQGQGRALASRGLGLPPRRRNAFFAQACFVPADLLLFPALLLLLATALRVPRLRQQLRTATGAARFTQVMHSWPARLVVAQQIALLLVVDLPLVPLAALVAATVYRLPAVRLDLRGAFEEAARIALDVDAISTSPCPFCGIYGAIITLTSTPTRLGTESAATEPAGLPGRDVLRMALGHAALPRARAFWSRPARGRSVRPGGAPAPRCALAAAAAARRLQHLACPHPGLRNPDRAGHHLGGRQQPCGP